MTRYTINIGDDFPLGGDEPAPGEPHDHRHGRRRYGMFLRVLFFLAVAAIVIGHPLKTLLVVGLVLFLRRSPRFAELRSRLRGAWRSGMMHDWSRELQSCRDSFGAWQDRRRHGGHARNGPTSEPAEAPDRYRGFV